MAELGLLSVLLSCNPVPSPVAIGMTPDASSQAQPASLRLANGEWPPYSGKDLPHYGCDAWAISEAFALQNIHVTYDFFPWARSYRLAADGIWDGTLEWADTPEHRQEFYLSADILSKQEWVFFHRVDHPFEWNSLEDLDGKVVGTTSGYVYSNAFQGIQQKGTVKFEEASSDEANLRKLLAGRLDLFPGERQVGYSILKNGFTPEERQQITAHPKAFNEFKPYLLLSKAVPQNKVRLEQFNRGWKQLKDSGRYAQIMQTCLP